MQICVDVAKALGATGTRTRVVSMPCWSLFEDQGEAYQLEGEPTAALWRLCNREIPPVVFFF